MRSPVLPVVVLVLSVAVGSAQEAVPTLDVAQVKGDLRAWDTSSVVDACGKVLAVDASHTEAQYWLALAYVARAAEQFRTLWYRPVPLDEFSGWWADLLVLGLDGDLPGLIPREASKRFTTGEYPTLLLNGAWAAEECMKGGSFADRVAAISRQLGMPTVVVPREGEYNLPNLLRAAGCSVELAKPPSGGSGYGVQLVFWPDGLGDAATDARVDQAAGALGAAAFGQALAICEDVLKGMPAHPSAAYCRGLAYVGAAWQVMGGLAQLQSSSPLSAQAQWWTRFLGEALRTCGLTPGAVAGAEREALSGLSEKWRTQPTHPPETIPLAAATRQRWVRSAHWLSVSANGRLAAWTQAHPVSEAPRPYQEPYTYTACVADLQTGSLLFQKQWPGPGIALLGDRFLADGRFAEVYDLTSGSLVGRKFTGGYATVSPAPWVRVPGPGDRFVRVYRFDIDGLEVDARSAVGAMKSQEYTGNGQVTGGSIRDISLDMTYWLFSTDGTRMLAPYGREVEAETGPPPIWALFWLAPAGKPWEEYRNTDDQLGPRILWRGVPERYGCAVRFEGFVELPPDWVNAPMVTTGLCPVSLGQDGAVTVARPDSGEVVLKLDAAAHGRRGILQNPMELFFGTPHRQYGAPDAAGGGGGGQTIVIPVPG